MGRVFTMFRQIKPTASNLPEVEVSTLRRVTTSSPRPERSGRRTQGWKSKLKLPLSLLFGLAVAVAWHFIHEAGDAGYNFSLSNPHLWFHLALESLVAVYAAGFSFVVWTLWERFGQSQS